MTKEELVSMAREAGFLIDTHAQQYQPNCILSTHGLIDENLQRFANLVAAAEREEIAKLADASVNADQYPTLTMLAQAIRMRGERHD